MDNLIFTLNAIIPTILLVLLGYFLKRINFFKEDFLKVLNKLVFMVLLPVLLFTNIYKIESFDQIDLVFMLYVMGIILVLFFIGLAIVILFFKDPKQKGVILQACFRSNYALIGIPLAISLTSDDSYAVIVASMVACYSIPLFNILAVVSLSVFVNDDDVKKPSAKDVLLKIVKNPLIIAVFFALFVVFVRIYILDNKFTIQKDIPSLYSAIEYVARCATPIALIVLGGRFTFKAVKELKYQIIVSTAMKIMIGPLIFLPISYFLGYGIDEFPALIALLGTPVGVSSVVMAQQMKSDDNLAGQVVVWSTALSAFSLFIIIFICKSVGVL